MKKLFVLFAGVLMILLYSCEEETIVDNQPSLDAVTIEPETQENIDGKLFYKQICIYFYDFGRWQFNPWPVGSFGCNPRLPGICRIYKRCIPIIIPDPCWIIPCWIDFLDPWDIYREIDPGKFGSFKDKFELDIDPKISSVPFAINEQIMGLQFYERNELMSFKEKPVFTLERDMTFDAETSKEIGLSGNVVQAGEYPILYNKENGTFNVLLSVEKGFEKDTLQR